MCEKAPRSPASYAAAEGSVAHLFAEAYASGKVDFETLCTRVGQIVEYDGHRIGVIDEMVDGAVEYADAISDAENADTVSTRAAAVALRW